MTSWTQNQARDCGRDDRQKQGIGRLYECRRMWRSRQSVTTRNNPLLLLPRFEVTNTIGFPDRKLTGESQTDRLAGEGNQTSLTRGVANIDIRCSQNRTLKLVGYCHEFV